MTDCVWEPCTEGVRCTVCGRVQAKPTRINCRRGKKLEKKLPNVDLTLAAEKLGITLADIGHYSKSLLRWTLAGFPVRSQGEVDRLYAICQGCEYQVAGRCSRCRCRTNRNWLPITNKIKMATEQCEVGKWLL